MYKRSRTIATVLLALAGAGIGAIVADQLGVSSWLEAKLYLAVGATVGVAVAELLSRLVAKRDGG